MNNDPGPSFAARQPLPPRSDDAEYDDNEYDAEERRAAADGGHGDMHPDEDATSQKKEKRRDGLLKKLELVTHLRKTLDMTVVAYICTLYYMECSLFRFLIRLFPHYSFLAVKDDVLLPGGHPPIYLILAPNLLCMLAHMSFALPEAGEATRGYLHGGVIIDFIGQKPPRSSLAFLLFDLVILGVQSLMLAVLQEQEKLKKAVLPRVRPIGDQTGQAPAPETTQDHDAEERGVLRDDETYLGDGGGLELQSLSGGGNNRERRSAGEDEQNGDTYSSVSASADMLDIIRSGDAVLANFHVIHAVRTVGSGAQSTAAYMLQTAGYGTTLAALAAQQRSRLVISTQQR
ncbi:DUF1746-domain-containing protein [Parathielavia appendiculata]|uniref:DUF1746-domain-containing protein n=1 Tax=Parathielavia appendiculata TaxID=2587402 RepID=A0AAN6Z808_9PEZI|nr:DUF1746-domain-containing protein [Parathielavia appendiculata]